jgi:hypothetical protein
MPEYDIIVALSKKQSRLLYESLIYASPVAGCTDVVKKPLPEKARGGFCN